MAKKVFKVSRTVDEESKEETVTVEDTEENKEDVIDMGNGETMDAGEYKEVMDMCKDMGYESIKDMAAAHKEMKDAKPDEKVDDEKPDDKDDKNEKKDDKTKDAALNIEGLQSVEETIAGIEDKNTRDAMIKSFGKFKDEMKGYVKGDEKLSETLLKAQPVTKKTKDEQVTEFVDYAQIVGSRNPHKN